MSPKAHLADPRRVLPWDAASMRVVAPFGFYGWGNIGDEATLNGFARLLDKFGTHGPIWIGSRDPGHTARVEPAFRYFNVSRRDPRRWQAMMRASLRAIVGGTPIQDVLGDYPMRDVAAVARAADASGVPLLLIGVGVEELRREESRKLFESRIGPFVTGWSVRSDRDRARLEQWGVSPHAITVAADMAWLIEPVTADFGRRRLHDLGITFDRPLIGINLANENYWLDRQPAAVDALAKAIDRLVEEFNAQTVFLANEVRDEPSFDKAAATKVMSRMTTRGQAVLMPNEYFAPREMMSIVSNCNLTISNRYHFCIFSAIQDVPFIAIERSTKLEDLCSDLHWPGRVSLDALDAAVLVSHGMRLMEEDRLATQAHLREMVHRLEHRAWSNIDVLRGPGDRHAIAGGFQSRKSSR